MAGPSRDSSWANWSKATGWDYCLNRSDCDCGAPDSARVCSTRNCQCPYTKVRAGACDRGSGIRPGGGSGSGEYDVCTNSITTCGCGRPRAHLPSRKAKAVKLPKLRAFPEKPRTELKYLLEGRQRVVVLEYFDKTLKLPPDPHSDANHGYEVSSVYLDSSDHKLLLAKRSNTFDRYKLRVRSYSPRRDEVFLEVKRRKGARIYKTRAKTTSNFVEDMNRGIDRLHSASPGVRNDPNAAIFFDAIATTGARPTVLVQYTRRAWNDRDAKARVTFDRDIRAWPVRWIPTSSPPTWFPVYPYKGHFVLEVKYSEGEPKWLDEMERTFSLQRIPVSKFGSAVALLATRESNRRQVTRHMIALALGTVVAGVMWLLRHAIDHLLALIAYSSFGKFPLSGLAFDQICPPGDRLICLIPWYWFILLPVMLVAFALDLVVNLLGGAELAIVSLIAILNQTGILVLVTGILAVVGASHALARRDKTPEK